MKVSPQNSIKIGFEGMPGAGKTSTLVSLARRIGDRCLPLPELNIDLEFNQDGDVWKVYHNLWKKRFKILRQTSDDNLVVLMDRTYFSNLAFTYALNLEGNLEEYEIQKGMIKSDFEDKDIDLIFFLDVSPEEGLKRRHKQNDFPQHPWSDINFLKRLREFYRIKLPELYKGKIIYISTEGLTPEALPKMIYDKILERFGNRITTVQVVDNREDEETQLLDYAFKRNIGRPYSHGFNVLGYPTIYFRQYAVQLDKGNPQILDNERLTYIINTERTKTFDLATNERVGKNA